MPRTVVRRPWLPLLPLLALGAEDPAPSKLSFFGSSEKAAEAAPSKLSFFGSASAGDARRQEDGQDSKRAAAVAADAPKRPFFGSSSAKQAREQEEPVLSDLQPDAEQEDEEVPSIFDSVNHPPPGFHRDPAGSTVAAGHHHTCALRQSSAPFGGIAHCWGEDTMGAVSRVPVELTFIQLSSGHFHSCGITLDEKLVCWGGPNPKRFEPPGLYQQVSCGAVHTCGLRKDGQVKCWGEDHDTGCTKPPSGKFVQVQAGNAFSCGLRPSGLVECWGNDRKGQSTPPDGVQFLQIATSNVVDHACGLTLGARDLKCWGDNRKGQSPDHVDGPWEQVACGSKATCAIADGGSHAECFGAAAHVYDTREKTAFRGRTLEQVSMGHGHLCVLDVEGEVVCHGHPVGDPLKRTHARHVPDGFIAA